MVRASPYIQSKRSTVSLIPTVRSPVRPLLTGVWVAPAAFKTILRL